MALTTYVKGRAYDWSHAIGRAAANGTGFNYPQTMCLGNDGDIFVANRGNENTFAMRVNRVKIGGPGEEELLAEFCMYGETDGHSIWPFGVATTPCTRLGLRCRRQIHSQVGNAGQRAGRIEESGRDHLRRRWQRDCRRQRQ